MDNNIAPEESEIPCNTETRSTKLNDAGQNSSWLTLLDQSVQAQVDLARSWLDTCVNEHEDCTPYVEAENEGWLPSRLIQIDDDQISLRLVRGEDIKESQPVSYVALSHCWGDARTVPKTTKENLDQRLENIRWQKLSQSFQDAVVLTKALGFSYLWIDSLCIIQGNLEDTNDECTRMHFIYSFAKVVICASSAVDGSGGMLFPQSSSNPNEEHDDEAKASDSDYTKFVDWENLVSSGPLVARAWTMQERQLATRLIHLTDRGIAWECVNYMAAQSQPEMLSRNFAQFQLLMKTFGNFSSLSPSHRLLDRHSFITAYMEWFNRWLNITMDYSTRKLTYESDKLPALSGLATALRARAMPQLEGEQYLAGIWRVDIARGLLWKPAQPGPSAVKQPTQLPPSPPSWSWIACNGEIEYGIVPKLPMKEKNSYLEVISYTPDLVSKNTFGEVRGAELRLRAHTYPLRTGVDYEWAWKHTLTEHGEHEYRVELQDGSYVTVSFDYGDISDFIIAVHGLNPWGNPEHALDTWRKPKGENGNLWLRDELPKTLPHARIFLYSYDSSPAFGSSKERFVHQANDLLERIHIKRTECDKRPVILIGHSLGGILIKQALVNAHSNSRYTPIKQATSGLVFFGTPHAGGKDALVSIGKLSARVATSILRNPSKDVMEALTKGSLFSDVLQESWRHQLNLYKIVSFYEGIGDIVPRESAVLGLSGDVENQVRLEADHSNVCCFDLAVEDEADNYEVVAANIKELYKASLKRKSTVIPSQNSDLEAFAAAMKTSGGGDAMNLLASYITPNPQDYENPELNYVDALNQDCKRSAMHLTVVRHAEMISNPNYRRGLVGQPVNVKNSNGDNPFHTAATLGRSRAFAEFFLKQNVKIDAQNNQGSTVLHLYVVARMHEAEKYYIISLLIQHRANSNLKNRDGFTPLYLAVLEGQVNTICLLLDHGGASMVPDQGKDSVLHASCSRGNLEVTMCLLGRGANAGWCDANGLTALHIACGELAKGADGRGPFRQIWELLKKWGADEEARDQSGTRPRDLWRAEMEGYEGGAGAGVTAANTDARYTADGASSGGGGYGSGNSHGKSVGITPAGTHTVSNPQPSHHPADILPGTHVGTTNLQTTSIGSAPTVTNTPHSVPPLHLPLPPRPNYFPTGGSYQQPSSNHSSPPPPMSPPPGPQYGGIGPVGGASSSSSTTKSFQTYMTGGQSAGDIRTATKKFSEMASPLKGWGRRKT
ncbi:MAG: hypothetical protein Q9219_005747 [cf. Caloplaca sp. 3 TL-2023]